MMETIKFKYLSYGEIHESNIEVDVPIFKDNQNDTKEVQIMDYLGNIDKSNLMYDNDMCIIIDYEFIEKQKPIEILNNDSWLTDSGKIIEVGESGHNDYASELLENELGFEGMMKLLDRRYPYQILHKRGWVRIKFYSNSLTIMGDCSDLTRPQRNTMDPRMNLKQLKVAKRICKQHNYSFHNAINESMFHD